MTFSEALNHIKSGNAVHRRGWDALAKRWVALLIVDETKLLTLCTKDGAPQPWTLTDEDLFADDWIVVHDWIVA